MNIMDYENSKRFRRNKLEEDNDISDNEIEEWDEGFGAEEFISFDEELPEYDENNPTPTCFSRWFDTQKYHYHGKIPLPIQLPKEDKKQPKQHPLKWAKFTDETEIESTMVVIGKIPLTRIKRNVTSNEAGGWKETTAKNEGTKKKRNYAFTTYKNKKITKPKPIQNQLCFSITKGIECPHYSCTYIHNYSQIEHCQYNNQCRFVLQVDDELYLQNNNGKCLKRHLYESIESYLLRLEIPIYNCTSLVLQVNPHVHSDCNILRRVLESAKNCRVAPLIWQKKKVLELKTSDDSNSENNEEDDDWKIDLF